MAKTYFEYADRLPESQVNWFKVGKDITDAIKKEDELREKRKAATEEQFRKDTQELANAPQGNSDLVNKWTLDYAGDATDYLLQINRLLKSGAMKPKDYNIINQNLRGNTSTLFNLAKEYQAEYKEKMERAQPGGDGSAAEAQIMGMIEGFANLKDTKAIINPLDGSVSVGKMVAGKDGTKVLAEGADNYMTVNELRNRIKQKIDKYKVDVDLAGEAKLLGDVVNEVVSKTGSSRETGFLKKITDPTQRKGLPQEGQQAVDAYIKTENDIVNSKLTNPYNTSSILFDWAGGIDKKTNKPYQVVFDEKLAKTSSHYILYSIKGGMLQPDFESTEYGREQKQVAGDFIRNKFRSMLEQKTELQPFSQPRAEQPSQASLDLAAKNKRENMQGNMIAKLYSGTPTEQQAAVTYFGGLPNVRSVQRNDDGITVTTINGITKNIPFKVGEKKELMGQDDFVRSASSLLLGGDVDVNQVLRGAIGTGTKTFQPGTAGVEAQSTDPNELYGKYISSSIASVPADEADAVKTLSPALSKIGFNIREAVVGSDAIKVVNPNGEESEAIYLDDPNAVTKIQEFVLNKVPGEKEDDKFLYLYNLVKKGVLGKETKKETPTPGRAPR